MMPMAILKEEIHDLQVVGQLITTGGLAHLLGMLSNKHMVGHVFFSLHNFANALPTLDISTV